MNALKGGLLALCLLLIVIGTIHLVASGGDIHKAMALFLLVIALCQVVNLFSDSG